MLGSALLAAGLAGCALFGVALPDLSTNPMERSDGKGASVLLQNASWHTYANIELDCKFELSSGKIITKRIRVEEIKSGQGINIRSDTMNDPNDISSFCKVSPSMAERGIIIHAYNGYLLMNKFGEKWMRE